MEFENPILFKDGKHWKRADDSVWVPLEFPRVCMKTLASSTTIKSSSSSSSSSSCVYQSLEPIFMSEMFSCLLESAKRKLEEALAVKPPPCCTEGGLQGKKDCVGFFEVSPCSDVLGGGYRCFSQLPAQKLDTFAADKNCSSKSNDDEHEHDGGCNADKFVSPAFLWSTKTEGVVSRKYCSSGTLGRASTRGGPPEGLVFVLPLLLLKDLLSLEQVCKSLKEAVSQDTLLWRHLKVDSALGAKLTDEALLKLAARGRGRIQVLELINCVRISDAAVEEVVASNPEISQILLPGCIRINVDAVVRMGNFLAKGKTKAVRGLQAVKIRGTAGITRENLEQLQRLLGIDASFRRRKPHFLPSGADFEGCPIDMEACPLCREPRPVYDCTGKECRNWEVLKLPECRGCLGCIGRCEDCGICLRNKPYEETFSLRTICTECCDRQPPKCIQCNRPGYGETSSDLMSDLFIRAGGRARSGTIYVCAECAGALSFCVT